MSTRLMSELPEIDFAVALLSFRSVRYACAWTGVRPYDTRSLIRSFLALSNNFFFPGHRKVSLFGATAFHAHQKAPPSLPPSFFKTFCYPRLSAGGKASTGVGERRDPGGGCQAAAGRGWNHAFYFSFLDSEMKRVLSPLYEKGRVEPALAQ